MRSKIFIAVVSCLPFMVAGCFGKKDDLAKSDSGLSQVDIATPTVKDMEKVYGANCANIVLKDEIKAKVGNKTGCDAILALTNEYQLTIEGGACEGGGTGTNLAAKKGELNNQSITTELKRNCDYSVKLELGYEGVYYFDNAGTWKNNLPRTQVAGETAKLTIKLRPTAAGEGIGIPPGSQVESTGFTNLKINVNFGTEGTGGSDNGSPIEFVAPTGWTGNNFQGDSVFTLQRAN